MRTVIIPCNTFPPGRHSGNYDYGWGHDEWTTIGFVGPGRPPYRVRPGCAVIVKYGDLLGPDDDPWRIFETIKYETMAVDAEGNRLRVRYLYDGIGERQLVVVRLWDDPDTGYVCLSDLGADFGSEKAPSSAGMARLDWFGPGRKYEGPDDVIRAHRE